MPLTLQIVFRNMDASVSAEALVRQRAAELEHFSDRLGACRVVLDCVHRRQQQGRLYQVHIDLAAPGGQIMVTHDAGTNHANDDVNVAIRHAFDAARRQLQDQAHKRDAATKKHEAPMPMR
jgi:ribosome-associated translation inhibitor RaiA